MEKIIGTYIQCIGQSYKNWQTQFCIASFNMAHMRVGDADTFCQRLLRQAVCFPDFSNSLTDFIIIHKITCLYSLTYT